MKSPGRSSAASAASPDAQKPVIDDYLSKSPLRPIAAKSTVPSSREICGTSDWPKIHGLRFHYLHFNRRVDLARGQGACTREVARVLKPGGMGFISVWNRLSGLGRFGASWAKWAGTVAVAGTGLNPHGPGNRVCWEAGGYVLWHYFSFGEAQSLFDEAGLGVLGLVPFEGSMDRQPPVRRLPVVPSS